MTLSMIALLLAWLGAWVGVGFVVLALLFYLLVVRESRCRVETLRHEPCRWRVRGVLGSCEWHDGFKRGLPRLVPGGWGAPPRFMWPRHDLVEAASGQEVQSDPRARGDEANTVQVARPGYDWIMMALSAASVLIALVTLILEAL
jgi:hypothetical protein